MASIGWIDFSQNDRSRVGSVLDMLRPEGMVDELGMGTMRDALANQLFPGISTIQTKAKYFFIIPYILQDYQALKPAQRRTKSALRYLEETEYDVMWQLAEKYNYEEGCGVIGITKRKPNKIVRRPSAIYWNGLYTYNFINTGGLSADTFLNQATHHSIESLISVQQGDDSPADDADVDHENVFKVKVPFRQNWREDLTLDLQHEEAEFFRDRIVAIGKNKLIAELLQNNKLWNVFTNTKNFMDFAKAALSLSLPNHLQTILTLAHDFSELMYGAHLAYNCQLQHKVFSNNHFDDAWENWKSSIESNMIDYASFDPEVIFTYAITTRPTTIQFVRDWWSQAKLGFPNPGKRDSLVEQQEAMVKGSKARIRWKKTDDVREENWHGLRHFDYRFVQAGTILKDIKTGLSK